MKTGVGAAATAVANNGGTIADTQSSTILMSGGANSGRVGNEFENFVKLAGGGAAANVERVVGMGDFARA